MMGFEVYTSCILGLIGAQFFLERKKRNEILDNPKRIALRMPAPRLYALTKKAIAGFRLMEHRFVLAENDPTTLSLRAVCEWREKDLVRQSTFGLNRGNISQVILDVKVGSDPIQGSAFLELHWQILDGVFRSRGNLIQSSLSKTIVEAVNAMPAIVWTGEK